MEKQVVIICVGISCSGKTTWSKEQQQKKPGKFKRLNRDDFRFMLDNYSLNNKNEEFINVLEEFSISQALSHHYSVIV